MLVVPWRMGWKPKSLIFTEDRLVFVFQSGGGCAVESNSFDGA